LCKLRKHFDDRAFQSFVLFADTWSRPNLLFCVRSHRLGIAGRECRVFVALPDEFFEDEVALLTADLFRLFEEIPLIRPFAAPPTVFFTVF
jgi:hypothetical protein